jgi:hypothetical protein
MEGPDKYGSQVTVGASFVLFGLYHLYYYIHYYPLRTDDFFSRMIIGLVAGTGLLIWALVIKRSMASQKKYENPAE